MDDLGDRDTEDPNLIPYLAWTDTRLVHWIRTSKTNAEIIVKALDGVLPEAMSTAPAPSRLDKPRRDDKPKPVMPIPEDKLPLTFQVGPN